MVSSPADWTGVFAGDSWEASLAVPTYTLAAVHTQLRAMVAYNRGTRLTGLYRFALLWPDCLAALAGAKLADRIFGRVRWMPHHVMEKIHQGMDIVFESL